MPDIRPGTDNETLAEILAELMASPVFLLMNDVHQAAVEEAEARIRELPDEED